MKEDLLKELEILFIDILSEVKELQFKNKSDFKDETKIRISQIIDKLNNDK